MKVFQKPLEFEFILGSRGADATAEKTKGEENVGAGAGTDVDEFGDSAMKGAGTGSR
jgi:hypothetical protein